MKPIAFWSPPTPTPIRDSHPGPAWGPEICRSNTPTGSSDRGPAAECSDMLMLSPVCAFCVSAAWGPGPQSCQLSPAGLLSGQHVPSTRLPLGKSLPSPARDSGLRTEAGRAAPGRGCWKMLHVCRPPLCAPSPRKAFLGTSVPGSVLRVGRCNFTGDNRKPGDKEVSMTCANGHVP